MHGRKKHVVNTNQSNHIVHLFTFPCALSVQTHQIDLMDLLFVLFETIFSATDVTPFKIDRVQSTSVLCLLVRTDGLYDSFVTEVSRQCSLHTLHTEFLGKGVYVAVLISKTC